MEASVQNRDCNLGPDPQGQNGLKDEGMITTIKKLNLKPLKEGCANSAGSHANEQNDFISKENIALPIPDIEECGKVPRKNGYVIDDQENSPLHEESEDSDLETYDLVNSYIKDDPYKLINEKDEKPSANRQPEAEVAQPSDQEQDLEPALSRQDSRPREVPSGLPDSGVEGPINDHSQPGTTTVEQKSRKALSSSNNFVDGAHSNGSDTPSTDVVNPEIKPSTTEDEKSSIPCESDSDQEYTSTDTWACGESVAPEPIHKKDEKPSANRQPEAEVAKPSDQEQDLEPALSRQDSRPREVPSGLPDSGEEGPINDHSQPGTTTVEQKSQKALSSSNNFVDGAHSNGSDTPSTDVVNPEIKPGTTEHKKSTIPCESDSDQKYTSTDSWESGQSAVPELINEEHEKLSDIRQRESEAAKPSDQEQDLEPALSRQDSRPREVPSGLPDSGEEGPINDHSQPGTTTVEQKSQRPLSSSNNFVDGAHSNGSDTPSTDVVNPEIKPGTTEHKKSTIPCESDSDQKYTSTDTWACGESVAPELINEEHEKLSDIRQRESEAAKPSDQEQDLEPALSRQDSRPREVPSGLPDSGVEGPINDHSQPGTTTVEQKSRKALSSSNNFVDGAHSNGSDTPSTDVVNPEIKPSTTEDEKSSIPCESDSDQEYTSTDTWACGESVAPEPIHKKDEKPSANRQPEAEVAKPSDQEQDLEPALSRQDSRPREVPSGLPDSGEEGPINDHSQPGTTTVEQKSQKALSSSNNFVDGAHSNGSDTPSTDVVNPEIKPGTTEHKKSTIPCESDSDQKYTSTDSWESGQSAVPELINEEHEKLSDIRQRESEAAKPSDQEQDLEPALSRQDSRPREVPSGLPDSGEEGPINDHSQPGTTTVEQKSQRPLSSSNNFVDGAHSNGSDTPSTDVVNPEIKPGTTEHKKSTIPCESDSDQKYTSTDTWACGESVAPELINEEHEKLSDIRQRESEAAKPSDQEQDLEPALSRQDSRPREVPSGLPDSGEEGPINDHSQPGTTTVEQKSQRPLSSSNNFVDGAHSNGSDTPSTDVVNPEIKPGTTEHKKSTIPCESDSDQKYTSTDTWACGESVAPELINEEHEKLSDIRQRESEAAKPSDQEQDLEPGPSRQVSRPIKVPSGLPGSGEVGPINDHSQPGTSTVEQERQKALSSSNNFVDGAQSNGSDTPSIDVVHSGINSGFLAGVQSRNRNSLSPEPVMEVRDVYNKMWVIKRLFHKDDYIIGKWQSSTQLIELHSCQFTHPCIDRIVYIRKQTPGYLFTFDQEDFIARVHFDKLEELHISDFSKATKVEFLKKLSGFEIIRDTALNDRDAAYRLLNKVLEDISRTTVNNLDHAEDIFQLSKILTKSNKLDSKNILKRIINNNYISPVLKDVTHQLLQAEEVLSVRKKDFLKGDQYYLLYLLENLRKICTYGFNNHKYSLLNQCSVSISQLTYSIDLNIDALAAEKVFYINREDINLFSMLSTGMNEQLFSEFFLSVQTLLFEKLRDIGNNKSLKNVAPLAHPIYFCLCKHFQEIIFEISSRTNISVNDLFKKVSETEWKLIDTIDLLNCPLNHCLEQQYRLVFQLMKHFQPGCYSKKKKFNYQFKVFTRFDTGILAYFKNRFSESRFSNLSEDRLVWMYLFDSAVAQILSNQAEAAFELFKPLIVGFVSFIQETEDSNYESFRIVMYNTARFLAQTTANLLNGASEIDQDTLTKQIEFIEKAISNKQFSDFTDLIDVYNEYWKGRESIINKIPDKFPYGKFKQDMEKISQNLLNIVNTVLCKDVTAKTLIKYFRSFIEFLEDLNAIEFSWFIKENTTGTQLVNKDKNSYKVINPEDFINTNRNIPRHYLIEIIEDLLNIVNTLVEERIWSVENNLNAASELLSAIRKSFLYLKEQPDYLSFETFKDESTKPFVCLVENCNVFEDFKKRIDIIGDSFWYLRKQDEIDIGNALELYKGRNSNTTEEMRETLINCYDIYLKTFNTYRGDTSRKNYGEKITYITGQVKDQLESITINTDILNWNKQFKQNILPKLLGGLAAVWSVQTSKDIESTGKIFKPHCIQILCILRLLSVDEDSVGVDKHLAEVLTGQGKSVVLGLLSLLFALVGYNVRTVCYNEYLATRDQQEFTNLFMAFGISNKITYGTFEDMANEIIRPVVNGKTYGLRELVQNRVLNHDSDKYGEIKQPDISNTILLIDEVDVFFSDRFFGNRYIPCVTIRIPGLSSIQEEIWQMASKRYEKCTILEEVQKWILKKVGEQDKKFREFTRFLYRPGKFNILEKDDNAVTPIEVEYTNQSFYEKHLNMMIDTAIDVVEGNFGDMHKYKINDQGLITYKNYNGNYSTYVYNNYRNIFNYFRLKRTNYTHANYKNYGYILANCGEISYAKLPEEYPLILGVSGTISSLNDYEKRMVQEFYSINKTSIMPSFFGRSNLKFSTRVDFSSQDTEENWLYEIFSHANSKIASGRSVLIFFKEDVEMNKFSEAFRGKFNRLHTLTVDTKEHDKEKYVDEAGITRTVTLATAGMGRGVDFKSSVVVEKYGGVHVIQTFFSLDIKEEIQIKGRTARKDNKGSYELILCKEHLVNSSFIDETTIIESYESLCTQRNRRMNEEVSQKEQNIKTYEDVHKKTMEYLNSFFTT